jgi:uncharacterized membrane protein
MADKQVIISLFENEAAAEGAVSFMTGAGLGVNDAIAILSLDEKGELKTKKVGSHSFFKGAGIGAVVGLLFPIGLGVAAFGGGLLGLLRRKNVGLDEAERERLGAELKSGKAAVVVLLSEPDEAVGIRASLTDLGGASEEHAVSDETLEEAAAAAAAEKSPAS